MTELFYSKPEPVWVINNRRRGLDPYYSPGYAGREYGAPYAPRGTSLLPDATVKTLLYDMFSALKGSTWSVTFDSRRSLFLPTFRLE